MTTFKRKPKKTVKICDSKYITTLDTEHNKFVIENTNNMNKLSELKQVIKSYTDELTNLDNIENSQITYDIVKRKNVLHDDIRDTNIKIKNIENNNDELNYYEKTADILLEYYDEGTNTDSNSYKNITDIFNQTKSNNNSKSNLLDSYRTVIDNTYVSKNKKYNIIRYCSCGNEKIINYQDGLFECTRCGNSDIVVIESDKPNYKEHVPDTSNSAYKRINHLNELLAQIQAKESTDIPKSVYDKILVELGKECIDNLATLTSPIVKNILKKLNLTKYYEHVPNIINFLNGLPPPTMTREIEEKLRQMFNDVQKPFVKYCRICNIDRENFISYPYVLYKFCELLGLDHFLHCFKLPKGRPVLRQHDILWKMICNDLGWEFIPTV